MYARKVWLICSVLQALGLATLLARLGIKGRVEKGVLLWGAYGSLWVVTMPVLKYGPELLALYAILAFGAASLAVIVLASVTLSQEFAGEHRSRISLLGALISLLGGCLVIAEFVINPLVV